MHPRSQRFHEINREIADLHDLKQKDYGTDDDPFANVQGTAEFGLPPWWGVALRMNDKMQRIKAFIRKGELSNESIRDSFMDMAVYSVIALVLLEEEEKHG